MKTNVTARVLAPLLAILPLAGQSSGLNVVVVEGEGAVHNVRQNAVYRLAVRVEDGSQRPAAGATVAFSLPAEGASGTFPNRATQATATTDVRGMAIVEGLRLNKLAGKLQIRVVASYQGQTARATITQFNMTVRNGAQKSGSRKALVILSIVGAAAAGGAYAGLHKGGATATAATAPVTPSIGIAPGAGTVGAPH